jgi:hypothetical protein
MVRIARIGLSLVALTILAAPTLTAPLAAQEIVAGTWAGSLTGPDGQSFPVEIVVAGEGDDMSVTMVAPGQGEMPFSRVSQSEGQLNLGFDVPGGVTVDCELMGAEDGSYAGDCVGSDGQSGVLKMIPPQAR